MHAFAFHRAAHWLRIALAAGAEDVATLEARLGDALTFAGRALEAADAYLSAATRVTDRSSALELRRRAAQQLLFAGRYDRGSAEMRAVLAEIGLPLPDARFSSMTTLLAQQALLRLRGLAFTPRVEAEIDPGEPPRGRHLPLGHDRSRARRCRRQRGDASTPHAARARGRRAAPRRASALGFEVMTSAARGRANRARTQASLLAKPRCPRRGSRRRRAPRRRARSAGRSALPRRRLRGRAGAHGDRRSAARADARRDHALRARLAARGLARVAPLARAVVRGDRARRPPRGRREAAQQCVCPDLRPDRGPCHRLARPARAGGGGAARRCRPRTMGSGDRLSGAASPRCGGTRGARDGRRRREDRARASRPRPCAARGDRSSTVASTFERASARRLARSALALGDAAAARRHASRLEREGVGWATACAALARWRSGRAALGGSRRRSRAPPPSGSTPPE